MPQLVDGGRAALSSRNIGMLMHPLQRITLHCILSWGCSSFGKRLAVHSPVQQPRPVGGGWWMFSSGFQYSNTFDGQIQLPSLWGRCVMALESLSKWFIKFSLCLLIRIQIKALGILVRGKNTNHPWYSEGSISAGTKFIFGMVGHPWWVFFLANDSLCWVVLSWVGMLM